MPHGGIQSQTEHVNWMILFSSAIKPDNVFYVFSMSLVFFIVSLFVSISLSPSLPLCL